MIELLSNVRIDWMSRRRLFFAVSCLMLLIGAGSLAAKGTFRYGVDFQGGAIVYVRFSERPQIDEIRNLLRDGGAPDSQIQEIASSGEGFDVLIQVEQALVEDELGRGRELITEALNAQYAGEFEILRSEAVGPRAGADLRRQAVLATLYALGGMLVYIAFRFEWIYGFAAVVALLHDTLITLGFFSLFDKEINLTVIAGVLTLVGYSINDTIVVFDRVRENLRANRRMGLEALLNLSVNQTLSRTVITSGSTLIAALALYFFGGDVINGFAFALVVGVIVGSYSTIGLAAPLVLIWQNRRERVKAAAGPETELSRPPLGAK